MTGSEFDTWFDLFKAAFPAADDFVRKADGTGKATKALWFEVLKKRDLGDAITVVNRLFEGSIEPIPGNPKTGFSDWSAVPRHVGKLCAELHPVVPEWRQHTRERAGTPGIIKSDPSMAEAYRRCLDILEGYPPRSAEGRAAVSKFLDGYYGHKQSPVESMDRGNFEPAFDEWNNS